MCYKNKLFNNKNGQPIITWKNVAEMNRYDAESKEPEPRRVRTGQGFIWKVRHRQGPLSGAAPGSQVMC